MYVEKGFITVREALLLKEAPRLLRSAANLLEQSCEVMETFVKLTEHFANDGMSAKDKRKLTKAKSKAQKLIDLIQTPTDDLGRTKDGRPLRV